MELVQQEWDEVLKCYVDAPLLPVFRAHRWPTNGHMIADVARLGYIKDNDWVLDPTYGYGTWWTQWQPCMVTKADKYVQRGTDVYPVDFTGHNPPHLTWEDATFDVVAYDPPFKLNGTPSEPDARYGVDEPATIAERHLLMSEGLSECVRVCKPGGIVLMKCMDQVSSGKVQWQTRVFADEGERLGCTLIDRLDFLMTPRPQRSQVHAHANYSTLLVFRKARR